MKLTDKERGKLVNLRNDGFRYLARDKNGYLWAYASKPRKASDQWECELESGEWVNPIEVERKGSKIPYKHRPYRGVVMQYFAFVSWKDENPTSMDKLMNFNLA